MSRVKVNEITNKVATGPVDFPDGITGVALTVTGNVTVGGTIISEDTTNVDSVGWVTARSGLNVGPPATGIGATVHSNGNAVFAGIVTTGNLTAGSGTFSGDVDIADKIVHTGDTDTTIRFPSADTITAETGGSERFRIDSTGKVLIGTTTEGDTGADDLTIANSGSTGITLRSGTSSHCNLYFSDATSGSGEYDGYIQYSQSDRHLILGTASAERLKITSTGGVNFSNGELIENCNVTAGKLSDNLTINLDNGMVHLFTTTETTTATPNIMSTAGINTSMSNGDAITVTLITTAAAGAYCANIQVDGAAVTENWIGGSAPSDGGSSGVDVHTFTIIKTASETFTVLGNQSKTS
jgi:hypothetical protein